MGRNVRCWWNQKKKKCSVWLEQSEKEKTVESEFGRAGGNWSMKGIVGLGKESGFYSW